MNFKRIFLWSGSFVLLVAIAYFGVYFLKNANDSTPPSLQIDDQALQGSLQGTTAADLYVTFDAAEVSGFTEPKSEGVTINKGVNYFHLPGTTSKTVTQILQGIKPAKAGHQVLFAMYDPTKSKWVSYPKSPYITELLKPDTAKISPGLGFVIASSEVSQIYGVLSASSPSDADITAGVAVFKTNGWWLLAFKDQQYGTKLKERNLGDRILKVFKQKGANAFENVSPETFSTNAVADPYYLAWVKVGAATTGAWNVPDDNSGDNSTQLTPIQGDIEVTKVERWYMQGESSLVIHNKFHFTTLDTDPIFNAEHVYVQAILPKSEYESTTEPVKLSQFKLMADEIPILYDCSKPADCNDAEITYKFYQQAPGSNIKTDLGTFTKNVTLNTIETLPNTFDCSLTRGHLSCEAALRAVYSELSDLSCEKDNDEPFFGGSCINDEGDLSLSFYWGFFDYNANNSANPCTKSKRFAADTVTWFGDEDGIVSTLVPTAGDGTCIRLTVDHEASSDTTASTDNFRYIYKAPESNQSQTVQRNDKPGSVEQQNNNTLGGTVNFPGQTQTTPADNATSPPDTTSPNPAPGSIPVNQNQSDWFYPGTPQ